MLDTDERIQEYALKHSSALPSLLQKIERETFLQVPMPQMLSGPMQGLLLQMVTAMIRPQRILEIGTFTGYSAICMASAMPTEAKLYTIDCNEELEKRVRGYVEEAGMKERIDFRVGKALDIIPQLHETWDFVFIDADKQNYQTYYQAVFPFVRPGGFILADNVLWSGKVVEEKKDKKTTYIHAFNECIRQDDRVENLILPLRDGVNIIRKKG